MKNISHNGYAVSRVLALALTLMLLFGLCCPAASAESFLANHKGEITDAIGKVRSNLESLGDDLAAIQKEVQADGASIAGGLTELLPDSGLIHVNVSDVHDNNPDVQVQVDSSRFNDNMLFSMREIGSTRSATASSSGSSLPLMTTAPKTGDVNNLILWIVIVAVSALALAAALFFLLRKNKKRK